MASSVLSLPILSFLLLFLCFNSGGILRLAHGQENGPQATWCMAKPSSSNEALIENINYACTIANCGVIQQGGPCFLPDSLINHASVAMNLYYQKVGRHYWNCDFTKSGVIVMTDPSYDDCTYVYAQQV